MGFEPVLEIHAARTTYRELLHLHCRALNTLSAASTEFSLAGIFLLAYPCSRLLHHLIRAARACESVGFGLEGKAHSHDIAHSFLQGVVAFEVRVGIDIRVYFHVYSIEGKYPAQLIGYFHALRHFPQHPFFYAHSLCSPFWQDVHEAALTLSDEYDDRSEFGYRSFDLAIRAYAYFEVMPRRLFFNQDSPDFILYILPDKGPVEPLQRCSFFIVYLFADRAGFEPARSVLQTAALPLELSVRC